jgi:transcriptional regulator with XRE-family HTH domain
MDNASATSVTNPNPHAVLPLQTPSEYPMPLLTFPVTKSGTHQQRISDKLKEELARRRMSRAALAYKAKISISSLEKGLSGKRKFTDQTLIRIEQVLDIRLRSNASNPGLIAPETMGSYSRPAVKWLEGSYLTIRPSISRVPSIYAYNTEISWNETAGHLVFQEKARADRAYAQTGHVSVSHQSGHIYLATNAHGQNRLMILSRQGITGELYGLLLTLRTEKGARLLPVSMPVVLVPFSQLQDTPAFGTISENHKAYARQRSWLDRTLQDGFAVMMGA